MKSVKDAVIIRMVERISDHYRANISNRYIRPALLQMSLDKETWDQLENLTEKFEHFQYQGYHLDELYRQIIAAAKFVSTTRREIAPTLRYRLGSGGDDKVLRDMAVNNFSFNLKVFADLLNDLYIRCVEIDTEASKTSKSKRPLYRQIPELTDIGHELVGE